jgi:hypothetical protein
MQYGNYGFAKAWAILAGAVLIIVGVAGFVPGQALVGDDPDALLATDDLHNLVHLLTGVVALAIYLRVTGSGVTTALMAFGALYAAVFVLVLVSPDLFGLFDVRANTALHVIHAALAVVSLAVGYLAGKQAVAAATA